MYEYTNNTYRHDIDLLKGLAIIAIVLYHAGWCKSGYLGVDVFLVISGFLIVPKVVRQIADGQFCYWTFLEKRLFRLLPLVLLVNTFALAIGFWGMLPGDLRYLSEESIAASVFGDNILEAIVTQNYWAAIYHKVLMHNWYLGVLFQFCIVFPLLLLLFRRRMKQALIAITIISFLLYLLPIDSIGNKYYQLPYRFFELPLGGLVAMKPSRSSRHLDFLFILGIVLMIFIGAFTIGERAMPYNLVGGTNTIRESFLPRELILLLTVLFTTLYIHYSDSGNQISRFAEQSKLVSPLGRMSLSVFLWHQPLIAFYRYFFADELGLIPLVGIMATTLLLSITTCQLIERKINIVSISRVCLVLFFLIVNAFALWIYRNDGIVRDVPELDLRKGVKPLMTFEQYTDRIYQYDKEFSEEDTRQRILVIGNSFARDFANILLESSDSAHIQLSYHYVIDDCPLNRVRQCDRIYFFGWKHDVPDVVWQNLRPGVEIWGIGTKNHGTSNGIFYKNRYRSDYFDQRTAINVDFHRVNRLLHEEWGDHYIDLLNLTLQPDGTVPIFTPDHHFITYDGMHLTWAGANYYLQLLNFSN